MDLAMGRLDGPRDGKARDGLLAMGRLAMGRLDVAMDLAMGQLAMGWLVRSTEMAGNRQIFQKPKG